MIRFLILFAVGYVVYRAVKSKMLPPAARSGPDTGQSTPQVDDVMVKDPFCEAYFAKRNGVHLHYRGEDLYFCSKRCRDGYLAAHGEEDQ